jgi:hypothetical protein
MLSTEHKDDDQNPDTNVSKATLSLLQEISSLSDDIASADLSIKELRVWQAKRRLSRIGLQPLLSTSSLVNINTSNTTSTSSTTFEDAASSQFGLSDTHAARLIDMKRNIPQESISSPIIATKELASSDADIAASSLRNETIRLHANILIKEKLAALGLDKEDEEE